MEAVPSRRAVAVMLSLLFAAPVGAAGLQSPGFDTCRAQKDCRRLGPAELDRLRGGMSFMSSIGPIEVTFGITQAVYINNKLVALTQLVGTGPGQAVSTVTPSPAQTQALNAALQGTQVTSPSSSAGAAGASSSAAAGPGTVQNSAPAATATTPIISVPQAPTTPAQTAVGSQSTASSSNAAAAGSAAPTVLVNGSTVTPGTPLISVPSAGNLRLLIVQNGVGNVAVPSAADIRAGTGAVIQNTANGQAIRAVTEMNVSMGLSRAMSAASIRNAVRQGMVNSRP